MNRPENTIEYLQKVENIQPQIYYHYTSLEALFSIIKDKTFRMTSLRSSNDSKELSYNVQQFMADFKSVCEKETDKDTKYFFELLIKNVEDNIIRFEKECKTRHTPYALCLSQKRDNLTHWDRYASSCSGVCIGFNVAALDVLYLRTNNYIFGMNLFDIEETLYTEEALIQSIRNKTFKYIDMLAKSTKNLPQIDPLTIIERGGFVYMAAVYQNIMKFVKNSSFIDEGEIRVYHETESISNTRKLIKSMAKDLDSSKEINFEKMFDNLVSILGIKEKQFMMSKNGIRSYHNLCLEKIWGSGLIPEIILGPACVQNRKELQWFLSKNGLGDTKVSVSSVPIR